MKSRILSGAVAVFYVTLAYFAGGGEAALKFGISLILPLACIWFSDAMGSFTGIMRGQAITSTTPGCLVAFGGWLLLLLPAMMGIVHILSR